MTAITTLLRTDSLEFGFFRCPPGDSRWGEENSIGAGHHVVFPQRAVVIAQSGHDAWVTNPNHVVFYDTGQTYRRGMLSPDGDSCRFVVLGPDLAHDLLASPTEDRDQFPVVGGPISDAVALRVHLLGAALQGGRVDAGEAELELVGMVSGLVRAAIRRRQRQAPLRPETVAARRRLAEDAKAYLSVRFRERESVQQVARAVGASPFYLARVFRDHTGLTLHGYRDRLRLRAALERIVQGETDLARLAVDLGYASHSHLDVRFRGAFGEAPSTIRSAA